MHHNVGIALSPTCASGLNGIDPPPAKHFTNIGQWSLSWCWTLHFMHHTSSRADGRVVLSCFKLYSSRHKFCSCVWNFLTPKPGSCIGVSCNLIAISNASAWVDNFCCDNTILRCDISDDTKHAWCFPSVKVMFSSRIILFSL